MKKIPLFILLTIVLFYGCGNSWSQSKMRKGPYIIYPGNNTSMKILWQLDTGLTCLLEWGTDTNYSSGSVITTETGSGTDEHQHIYIIDSLTPATKYFFRVTENNIAHYGSFRTAPHDTTSCITFYAYGDTRSNPDLHDSLCVEMFTEIVAANENNQTIILHAGDWNTSQGETYWDNEFFNRTYDNITTFLANIPLMGTRGNHEGDAVSYRKYWPYDSLNNYYSFDYGPVHFSVIDQYVDYADTSSQYAWLENDLASTNKLWKFVLLHEPAYTDESYHTNNTVTQTYIMPLCKQYGVQAIIGGHNHFYAHCFFDNIHHFTLGGGGAPLYNVNGVGDGYVYSESTLHFAKFVVCNDTVLTQIIRPDGTVADSISIPLHVNQYPKNNNYNIKIFPNPAKDIVYFETDNIPHGDITLKVINNNGKTVLTEKFQNTNKANINIEKLATGVYTLYFSGKGFTVSKNLIIEN